MYSIQETLHTCGCARGLIELQGGIGSLKCLDVSAYLSILLDEQRACN